MSANRKLLGEIQQVLKKVEEGVEVFDEIWEKVYAAEQQALKEKYEADLKKEIKKLQRLRDQIKTWIGSNEIKDKTALMEARKIIETKMEQFKVCEKDTKTKAYSKEGLAREARLDPKEALKEEKRQWLNDCLDKLNDLIDSVEAEREKVVGSAKGKGKNKEALEKFDNRVQKHKWHMAKLELIIKLLDNDDLEPSLISGMQDSLDYYIESAVDDDGALGVEHEFDIYEDLELDRVSAPSFDLSPRGVPTKEEEGAAAAGAAAAVAAEPVEAAAEVEAVPSQPAAAAVPAKKVPGAAPVPASTAAKKPEPAAPAAPAAKPVAAAPAAANSKISPKVTPIAGNGAVAGKGAPVPAAKVSPKPAAAAADDHADASKADNSDSSAPANSVQTPSAGTGMSWAAHAASAVPAAAPASAPVAAAAPQQATKAVPAPAAAKPAAVPAPAPVAASEPVHAAPAVAPVEVTTAAIATLAPQAAASVVSPVNTSQASPIPPAAVASSPATATTPPPPPLQQTKPNPELLNIMNQLKQSMTFSPEAMELDKQSSLLQYNPRNVYPNTHPTFPLVPQFTTQTEIVDLFERLPMDTLFFVFYFQQGTYQQYLAAKQLKKHSWRFHKKYMTWFQRHEEPKVATEEYEEGTYVYFDYESGWCQRIKSEFKFEYAYLEDELGGAPGEA